jgi:hypothetical protein
MHTPAILLAILMLLVSSPAGGATPAPVATPAATGTTLRVTLDALPPGSVAMIGIVRTTFEPGASLRFSAGAGPSVHYVEAGAVTIVADGAEPPAMIAGGSADAAPSPAAAPGTELTVEAGHGFVMSPDSTAEIRNAGDAPASTLDLLAATDAATDAETGVTHAILVQREATLPAPPVLVGFERVTLAPGDRLMLPAEPAQSAYATVERGQAFLLSGQGIHRGAEPMDVYILTVAPAGITIGT